MVRSSDDGRRLTDDGRAATTICDDDLRRRSATTICDDDLRPSSLLRSSVVRRRYPIRYNLLLEEPCQITVQAQLKY